MKRDNDETVDLSSATISRRKILGGMAAGGAALALGGLGSSAGATTREVRRARSSFKLPHGLQKIIGFSQPDTSAAIWQPLMVGAQEAANDLGYVLLRSHANSELSLQLAEIEDWIAEGAAGICVLPLDNNSIEPLITQAHAKHIKVLDYSDNALPHVDGWVIFDNLQGAKLVGDFAGKWVNKTLGGKAQVAMLTHNIQLTGRQRTQGCLAALQAVAPGAKLVATAEGVLSPQTIGPAESMLEAHPDINVFICIADEGCQGVLAAVNGTHPSSKRMSEVFICGFDGSVPTLEDIVEGTPVRATGALPAIDIGKAVVQATVAAIEGRSSGTKVNFPYVLADDQTIALDKKLIAESNVTV